MRLIHAPDEPWVPPVLTTSALEGTGMAQFWAAVEQHRQVLTDAGRFAARRQEQQVEWMWSMVREEIEDRLAHHPKVRSTRRAVEREVRAGTLTAALGAEQLVAAYDAT